MSAMETGQLLAVPYEMFEKLDVGALVVGPDLAVREINGPLQELGLGSSQAVGLPIEVALGPWLVSAGGPDAVRKGVQAASLGQVVALGEDIRTVFAEPLHRPHRLACVPLGTGPEAPVAVVFLDDSESRSIRGRFARILDSAPDGVMVIDPDRRVRVFNRACGELLGRDPRDVVRSNCQCADVIGCHTEEGDRKSVV